MNSCKLKSIIVSNFKSYKGKAKITHFNQFTVIIGPNGSGKSNFMDAIAFALGENWQNLRVNNLIELSYSGRSNTQNSSCYVELSFHLNDGNEKSFKRTLLANTESCKFEFNGTSVSSDDYKAELNSIGILDFGKNCLVYQEDVESITIQDPISRCKFFERMCGSQNLEKEYNIAKNKYEKIKVQEKLNFNELKNMKSKVKILSKEHTRFIEYENLKKEERDLKKNEQLLFLYHTENDLKKLEDTINEKEEVKDNMCEIKLELKRIVQELDGNIQSDKLLINQLETKIHDREKMLLREKEILLKHEREMKIFEKRKNDALKESFDIEKRYVNKKENLTNLNSNKELLISQLENLKKIVTLCPHDLNDEQFEEYFQLKMDAKNKTAIYSREIELEIRKLEYYRYKLENENRKKNDITIKNDFWTKQYQKLKDGLDNGKENLTSVRKSLEEKEKLRENLLNKMNASEKKLKDLERKLETIVEQLKNMNIEKECLQKESERSEILIQMKNNINGIVFGRLIGLCKPCDSRYEIALAKIFEENANAIVTDTTDTVEECIQFLKNQNGYEAFIPLDNIRVKSKKHNFGTIKGAKYAFDLIEFPPEIERAVRFVTENILICENNEIAKKLSSGEKKLQHTCVSLNGTMFKKYGRVSGGTSYVSKISKRFNEENFQNLKLQKKEIEKELKAVSAIEFKKFELESCDSEINVLRKKIQFIEGQLKSDIVEKEKVETKLGNFKETSEEISKAIEEIKNELLDTKAAINTKSHKIYEIEDEIFANFCQKVGFANIRVFEKGDNDYEERIEKIQEIENHLARINDEMKFEESKNFDSEIIICEKIVTEMETELKNKMEIIKSIKCNIIELESEIKNIEKDAQDRTVDNQKTLERCQRYKEKICKQSQEIKTIQENIKKMKSDKLVIKNDMIQILMNCRSMAVNIPLISGNLNDYLEEESENIIEIDYSDLKEDYKLEENKAIAHQEFIVKFDEIRSKLENCIVPDKMIDVMLKEAKKQLLKLKRTFNEKKKANQKVQNTFEDIKIKRKNLFESFFNKVNDKIDSIYKVLTQNDAAQALLITENSEEPYLNGVIYNCIVPGKKYLSMEGLSGGEKTVTAFALLLAIQKANPAPFMLLDEMDAALDLKNAEKITNYIENEDKQFILISHKEELSSKAMGVIGVTKKGQFVKDSCLFTVNLQKYRV